ncbi:MAG: hypothetical protein A2508_05325 [Candidatus Lambdaproteobacteria bacterium RIFOXYD12_FULL_49_8]|uniref:ATP synthase subunit I n=1 Tax=Candidatus Lambdaproteobacteria bacterium RIFOXYD2_FULL_50_16 TaxID=1817772 RepID=A0A1F6GB60_9PROT|nr:MAG: hypothetical protein A2527_07475 [Candidatus Lambdaproteobacteria bacterium RIFOXYD2_FULL_50_16]OGG97723.1 MAG: hypothetical protein A2508_05325 [Candidatus Lambdaproteobacteria bacterium RIFOXYD12_FULL_49_8]
MIKDPREKKRLTRTNLGLLSLITLTCGGGWAAFGVDFALGALVGSAVVAFNFYASQFLMARLFISGQPKAPVAVFYVLKFGISMAFLFLAVTRYKMDTWGIMAGLATLPLISLGSSLMAGGPEAESNNHLSEDN